MASSAKRRRVDDDGGGGGGEVPPLLNEYGGFSAAVEGVLIDYDEDMIQRITDEYTVDAQHRHCGTLLMGAAYYGLVASVRFLIERGAAVNIQTNNLKRTALHDVCISRGIRHEVFEEMLVSLLRAGADPTLKDKDGETPRDWT